VPDFRQLLDHVIGYYGLLSGMLLLQLLMLTSNYFETPAFSV